MKKPSPKFLIFMTVFVDLLGFGIIIPILPAISAQFLPEHYQGLGAGVLMTAYSLLQMLFSSFWGRLSDRYGRRPVLLVSLAGSTLSYLMFAFSHNFTWLLVSRVFAGICGANITAAQAYIADITTDKERTGGMGLIGMAFGLGFAFGPVIGGGATHAWELLRPADPFVHAGPGLAAAAICGLNWLWALLHLPESLPRERRAAAARMRRGMFSSQTFQVLRHRALGPLILLYFLLIFSFANIEVSFVLWAKDQLGLELRPIYGLFVFIGLVMAVVQGWLVRRLVKVVPETTLTIAGGVILTVALAGFTFFRTPLLLLIPMGVMALGQGLANPPVLALISRNAQEGHQGNVMGAAQAAAALARIVGPLFGGILFDVGANLPFWVAAVLMAATVQWAVFTRARLTAQPA